jgi:hypothetical protein
MSDPNQNPFAAYQRAASAAVQPAAPAAPNGGATTAFAQPPAPAPAPAAVNNPGGFGGASLEWGGNDNDPNAKTVRLRDRLNEADTERRKDEEAAIARERAAEIRREVRMAKIKYMTDMPDSQPAGTGTLLYVILLLNVKVKRDRFLNILELIFQWRNSCLKKVYKTN